MKSWFSSAVASAALLLGLIALSGRVFTPRVSVSSTRIAIQKPLSGTVFTPRSQGSQRAFTMLPYSGQWAGYFTITGPQKQILRYQMIIQLRPDGRCDVLSGPEDAPLVKQSHAVKRDKRDGETLLLYTAPRDISAREKQAIFISRLTFSDKGKYATMEPLKVTYADAKKQRREKSLQGLDDFPIVTLEKLASTE